MQLLPQRGRRTKRQASCRSYSVHVPKLIISSEFTASGSPKQVNPLKAIPNIGAYYTCLRTL